MAGNAKRDEIMNRLVEGVRELTSSDRWQEWLKAQSRFHHYSFGNVLLIAMQCPQATRIAGFHAWRKLGRNVRKGEKAIWILAPVTQKIEVELRSDTDERTTETRRMPVAFKAAAVFDISQTDGEDLPEVCSLLDGGDTTDTYSRLVDVATGIGFTVEDADFADARNGDCTHDLHRIRVAAARSDLQRVKTLVHEIAHAMLHEQFDSRPIAELEAESIAYIVCANLGIDSGDYTFGYVSNWAGGGDEAVTAIKALGSRVQKTADSILEQMARVADSESKVA